MENNTALVLKQDGNIYVMNMPEKPIKDYYQPRDEDVVLPFDQEGYDDAMSNYESSLKQALSSAVLCNDQEQAKDVLYHEYPSHEVKKDHPYVIPGLTFTEKSIRGGVTSGRYTSFGKYWCDECCNGDRCDDHTHLNRRSCKYCKGSGFRDFNSVALLSLQEKTCKHRYDGQSIDGKVRCHWCGEVEEKTEKQEPEDHESLFDERSIHERLSSLLQEDISAECRTKLIEIMTDLSAKDSQKLTMIPSYFIELVKENRSLRSLSVFDSTQQHRYIQTERQIEEIISNYNVITSKS